MRVLILPMLASVALVLTVLAWGTFAQAPETIPQLPPMAPPKSWPNTVLGGLQILSGMFVVWMSSAAYRMQGQLHKLEADRDLWRERAIDHGWKSHDHQRDRSEDEPPLHTP